MKNLSVGVFLALCFVGVYIAWKIFWAIAAFILPFVLLGVALYFLGYYAPKEWHEGAEKYIRKGLDWLDLNGPMWVMKVTVAIRSALDWFGLKVGSASA